MTQRKLTDEELQKVMTVKHTPGPWVQYTDWYIRAEGGIGAIASVCIPIRPQVDDDECRANARLIAAAPEMYQLIEKCYKVLHLGVWEVDETDGDVCSQINDIMCNHFGDDWRPRREA